MGRRSLLVLIMLFDFACWAVIIYGIYWLIWG